jgi:hypothetical protein
MSKINLDLQLKSPDGDPVVQREGSAEIATLKGCAMNALLTPQELDGATPGLGYRLYTLADQIKGGGEVDLDADDVALIKQRIERLYAPWILGQCWDALEGGRETPTPKALPDRAFPARRKP